MKKLGTPLKTNLKRAVSDDKFYITIEDDEYWGCHLYIDAVFKFNEVPMKSNLIIPLFERDSLSYQDIKFIEFIKNTLINDFEGEGFSDDYYETLMSTTIKVTKDLTTIKAFVNWSDEGHESLCNDFEDGIQYRLPDLVISREVWSRFIKGAIRIE